MWIHNCSLKKSSSGGLRIILAELTNFCEALPGKNPNFLIALSAFAVGILYGILRLFGFPFPLGNPTIVILVLFLGGVQLISIGILGEYIGRIYEEVRQRPRYVVSKADGLTVDRKKT